jgi:TonB family protein
MRGKHIVSFGVAVGLLGGPPAVSHAQQAPIELTPSGHWSLDYGDHACTLSRQFTSAEGDVLLQIEQYIPGHELTVILSGRPISSGRDTVSLAVEPGVSRVPENQRRGRNGSIPYIRFSDSLLPDPPQDLKAGDAVALQGYAAAEASVTRLSVGRGLIRPISINVGAMDEPLALMRSCVDDLVRSFSMDPALATVPRTPATPSVESFASRIPANYPRAMLQRRRSARVRVVMQISPDGTVERCHAHNPEPYPEFELAACDVMTRHARYTPARDAAGIAIGGFDSMEIVYSLGS